MAVRTLHWFNDVAFELQPPLISRCNRQSSGLQDSPTTHAAPRASLALNLVGQSFLLELYLGCVWGCVRSHLSEHVSRLSLLLDRAEGVQHPPQGSPEHFPRPPLRCSMLGGGAVSDIGAEAQLRAGGRVGCPSGPQPTWQCGGSGAWKTSSRGGEVWGQGHKCQEEPPCGWRGQSSGPCLSPGGSVTSPEGVMGGRGLGGAGKARALASGAGA